MKTLKKYKIRLADYFSWLRDEDWHKEKWAALRVHNPWLRAIKKRLREIHKLDGGLVGFIYEATFGDGKIGYLTEIFQSNMDEKYSLMSAYGCPSMTIYNTLEDARQDVLSVFKDS